VARLFTLISPALSQLEMIKRLRTVVANHDAYLRCHYSQTSEETLVNFRSGDRLILRPRGGMAVSDSDIFEEVVLRNSYDLESKDVRDLAVLDIGAHTGIFAMTALRLGAKRLVAVEPEGSNFELLERNFELNKHYRAKTYRAAVAVGQGQLCRSLSNTGGHRYVLINGVSREAAAPEYVLCPSDIDELIRSHGVRVLKVDCEGCEECIFRDCQSLHNLCLVLAETHDASGQWRRRLLIQGRLLAMGFHVTTAQESCLAEGNFAILKATRALAI